MRSPAEQRRSLVTPGSSRGLSIDDDVAMKNIFSKPAAPTEAWSAGTRRLFAGVVAGILVLAALFNYVGRDAEGAGSLRQTTRFPETFRIGVISDPDKKSKAKDKAEWRAQYMTGTLRRAGDSYSVAWDEPASLGTGMNEAGRGAELSELVRWNGGLFAFDDRTGIMFEILHPEDSSAKGGKAEPQLVPRRIFMEGDGHNGKGMKFEWATVKDGQLYIGSFGKEYTNSAGETVHTNNLWVTVLDRDGRAQQLDWSPHYEAMRAQLGVSSPGYMIHEAVAWSPAHRRWFVLPRRVSKEAYDEAADEKRGSNHILSAAPDFSHIEHYTVGTVSPLRGFSSVKFLPGSKDSVIIALKSEENSERDRQTTYLTIYGKHPATGEWRVLMEETELPHEAKFEGLEVLSWS